MSSRSLPRRLLRGLRPAVLGPLRFAVDSGYWRSALLCQSVDRKGEPLLWVTYPAIAYLDGLDWRGRRVLEWGAGHSTLWWAARGAEVTSIEHDAAWVAALRPRLARYPGVSLHLAASAEEYRRPPHGRMQFDVAVIDGEDRVGCAQTAIEVVSPRGVIVLDNAEQPWTAAIHPLLAEAGWQRVDFHGFAPSVARPHCTSLFFRPECELMRPAGAPQRSISVIPG